MRYTLFLHYPEVPTGDIDEAAIEAGKQAFHTYAKALEDAGVLVSAEVLRPSADTTTLALRDGNLRIRNGPFADTKEQVGGTFVIDVPDLDAALAWAEDCPASQWGTIEIRPSAVRFADGKWISVS
jgi:hypothetical protein